VQRGSPVKRPAVCRLSGDRIIFPERVPGPAGLDAIRCLSKAKDNGLAGVTLDFGGVRGAYAEGMMQVVAHVDYLRRNGMHFDVILPTDKRLAGVFTANNWAHFMNPAMHDSSRYRGDKQLPVLRFSTASQQKEVVDSAMEVALHQMSLTRAHLRGLEWALNEITDNVLNHAEAAHGGLMQVLTFRAQRRIEFAVADGGRGISASMREGHPHLRSDREAIGEAIRKGVTRSRDAGQGNGLAGALRIAALAGGTFLIASQTGELRVAADGDGYGQQFDARGGPRTFFGTFVFVEVRTDRPLDLAVALEIEPEVEGSWDYLDAIREDGTDFDIAVEAEAVGFGSRGAGRALRTKLTNLLGADDEAVVNLDWTGVPLVSSSFADEVMGKLFVELGPLRFARRVRNRNIEPVVGELIDRAITQRVTQGLG
jgi:anti-sigma regulatory factor (Ser/Thr protein kinase)